ncbi:hypothetical protein GCM10009682_15140 [Luedemannella flava]|uniref:DUF2635 domain-containing protein n=1 Tax=Luedemannella flava TaxID=349316 RepID=A0ABN2LN39_9ACTN
MLAKGMTIRIPEGDRLGATGPTELLLTEAPEDLHPQQEWVRVQGVELDDGVVTDVPVGLMIRAAYLRALVAKTAATDVAAP